MERQFMNHVFSQVRKRMVSFEVAGCRQSRRVSGVFDREDEIHGFKNLCIYIDTALAGREEIISRILGEIDGFIYGRQHFNHIRRLSFFGHNSESLLELRAASPHAGIRAADWRRLVTKAVTENPPVGAAVIPRLHNPGSNATKIPERHDLALFFCRGRDIRTTEDQQKRFTAFRNRALWFFFGENEMPEMDAGGFVPIVCESCNPVSKEG